MKSKTKQSQTKWKWYVYKFFSGETCVYVGKGCKRRFNQQAKRFHEFSGSIVAYFKDEQDALSYEKANILEFAPQLNKAMMPDTPKPWTVRNLPDDKDFYAWCDAIGTRAMAARILMKYSYLFEPSKVEQIREVAYG